ncbi:Uncharacterised protein g9376 [Pycnogonum litorale]
MERILEGLQWKICLVYLDDIIVSTSEEELARLKEPEVRYLGHIVTPTGIATDPQKTLAVADWPEQENLSQFRSFLRLCTYYRRYVTGFASIAAPLAKDQSLRMEAQQEAFETLKEHLTSAPILAYPYSSLPYILDTDMLAFVGSVLFQDQVQHGKIV